MAIDHSQTYKNLSLKNLVHILRARSILKIIKKLNLRDISMYYDVGCSNGYLTNRVAGVISPKAIVGWDHSEENLSEGRKSYPQIEFKYINLNKVNKFNEKAQFVTCFETIEHVGNINAAINNIDLLVEDNGIILYTVPIESGFIGFLKYLIKTRIFNYTLEELSLDKSAWKQYEYELIRGNRISKFREKRDGWATHFGFDYRDFERELGKLYTNTKSWRVGTSRFILVRKISV